MKLITKEVRIGIAGVAALCLLVFGINYLKGINMFKPASYFYVKFHNVNGLAQSSPVFADGVRVGIVRDIAYDYNQPENVIVEVEVDTDLRIPKGSSAELVPELMGGVRMNILLANSRTLYSRRYDSGNAKQRHDGESCSNDARCRKDVAQIRLYPYFTEHNHGRSKHSGNSAFY